MKKKTKQKQVENKCTNKGKEIELKPKNSTSASMIVPAWGSQPQLSDQASWLKETVNISRPLSFPPSKNNKIGCIGSTGRNT